MELTQPIHVLHGVGQETEKILHAMNIFTLEDLLNYMPYRYEIYELTELETAKHGDVVTLEGKVQSVPSIRYYGGKKSKLAVRMLVGTVLITAVFFNRPYLVKSLTVGKVVTITGKWDRHRLTVTVDKVELAPYSKERSIESIYSLKDGIYPKQFRKLIQQALLIAKENLRETLPLHLRKAYKLYSRLEAYRAIHFPKNQFDLRQARRRFIYEELLIFQLKLQALRNLQREKNQGIQKVFPQEKLAYFISSLPFQLTRAQKKALDEILRDLTSPYQMNRLLQGDVGSGKTVIAAIALYATVLSGYQGALMVPTEILAEQHMETLCSLLTSTDVSIALLTSSVKGKKRENILHGIQTGEHQIVIGTHSLIQDDVHFHKLGLVITDEQHRFGVNQRRILKEKGLSPDVLFMTATPIPRTLAITVFGDMDVSTIDELPKGRKKVETYWVKNNEIEKVYRFIEKEVKKGRQAYVICPLIEESDKLDVQNAIDVHRELIQRFPNFSIGLLHGRLSNDEKENVMREFSQNKLQILVSTTVVEVGVNVPNATVMVINDADRFGLAQLHQLRGRVGRGHHQSHCILIADPKSEEGIERMRVMTKTNDGFVLSQKDLELRGPGDFFGHKQSGVPEFKFADLVRDYRALEVARNDAKQLIQSKQFWTSEEYECLRKEIPDGKKLD